MLVRLPGTLYVKIISVCLEIGSLIVALSKRNYGTPTCIPSGNSSRGYNVGPPSSKLVYKPH